VNLEYSFREQCMSAYVLQLVQSDVEMLKSFIDSLSVKLWFVRWSSVDSWQMFNVNTQTA